MPAELRPVCERLNDLLARLEKSFDRERRFTADVAHELRTPVAELRSLAEVALRWPDADSETCGAFRDALDIARQMESVVVNLLALARCEEEGKHFRSEPVRLDPLIRETLGHFAAQAERKKLAISIDIPPGEAPCTDHQLLGVLLKNLIENAVEYTPDRGSIRIAAAHADGALTFVVANTTDGLQPSDLPHLFERFWRKDAARTGSAHAGLGLSIASEFARLLGIDLSAGMSAPPTLAITLKFPPQRGFIIQPRVARNNGVERHSLPQAARRAAPEGAGNLPWFIGEKRTLILKWLHQSHTYRSSNSIS